MSEMAKRLRDRKAKAEMNVRQRNSSASAWCTLTENCDTHVVVLELSRESNDDDDDDNNNNNNNKLTLRKL